jgi:biofilm PGA synthesis protein PgaD
MKNPLIIERPELQSNAQRYGWSSITFIFWVLYIYLWLPLITLVAWWIGAKLFNVHFIQLSGYTGLIEKLGLYAAIILVISVILIGWAKIEHLRFKDKPRRKGNTAVTVAEVAHKYSIEESQLIQLRQEKSVVVHFSDKGVMSGIAKFSRNNKSLET